MANHCQNVAGDRFVKFVIISTVSIRICAPDLVRSYNLQVMRHGNRGASSAYLAGEVERNVQLWTG